MQRALLTVEDVSKTYDGFKAISNLNFYLAEEAGDALDADAVHRQFHFHGVVVGIEVVLGHDTKDADSGQAAAVLAVQFVHAVAVHDQLALVALRQI